MISGKNGEILSGKEVFLVIWGKEWYTATDNLIMGDAIFVVTPRYMRRKEKLK